MCTSPNTLVWNGRMTIDLKSHNEVPVYEFIGKVPYLKLLETSSPWIQVPCGQCLDCRIQQSRAWADRLIIEARNHEFAHFVTLTYDEDHMDSASLDPSHFNKFIQNLRNKFRGTKISYFMCGEYGGKTGRRHFHAIIFDCPLTDLSPVFKQQVNGRLINKIRRDNSDGLLYSPLIHKCWNYRGDISVGKVEYHSCQYVSGYVTSKYNKERQSFYDKYNLLPEYARMSKGIAKKYFDDNDSYLLFQGTYIVPSSGNAHISVTPRYYDKLFIKKYGEDLFLPIRYQRLDHRMNKLSCKKYLNTDNDTLNYFKDIKLRTRRKLRDAI